MAALYLMVGLPGSGKSTCAKKLAEETGAVCFSPDEWHIFLFGDDFHQVEKELHDARHDRVEELMWKVGRELLRKGVSVILDFGFWVEEQREEKRREARALGAETKICYLDTPMPLLLRRLKARGAQGRDDVFGTITEEDMREWAGLFQPPADPWRHIRPAPEEL